MFWKKKQVTTAPVVEGAAGGQTGKSATASSSQVATKAVKLSGPRPIPGLVENYIVKTYGMDADIIRLFKVVVRRRSNVDKTVDCRIYDQEEAEAIEVRVKDFTTFDSHPELVLYEGWFDESSKKVEISEKRRVNFDVPLFTLDEILQKIEALKEPGASVYFYQNAGSAAGGPLGRGAAIVELNPDYGQKKAKKYNIYTANVIGMEPVAKKNKLYDDDKPKEIAKWVAQSHKKRAY